MVSVITGSPGPSGAVSMKNVSNGFNANSDTHGSPSNGNSSINGVNNGHNGNNGKSLPKRVEVDTIMTEFQANMGSNWDRYRDVITHFLTGEPTTILR